MKKQILVWSLFCLTALNSVARAQTPQQTGESPMVTKAVAPINSFLDFHV